MVHLWWGKRVVHFCVNCIVLCGMQILSLPRERDEVVNEQAIIEDLYERELMHKTEDSQSTLSS